MALRVLRATAVFLLALAVAAPAWADHDEDDEDEGGYSVILGDPFWMWDFPPPYWYDQPQVVAVPTAPPAYIQRGGPSPAPSYWYYCEKPRGYYPYVRNCPGGWRREVPTPPPAP